jgi:quinol monooxygenase YgiN
MNFVLAAILLSAFQQGENPEDAVLSTVKKNLTDTTKPFTLVVKFKVKPADAPKFEAALAKAVKETRKEKGNLAYELSKSPKGPVYVIYERWENVAALEAHLKSDQYKNTAAAVKPLLDGQIELELLVPVPAGD